MWWRVLFGPSGFRSVLNARLTCRRMDYDKSLLKAFWAYFNVDMYMSLVFTMSLTLLEAPHG